LYGLGQIAYKNYLYFDFSYRTDWSSTLPAKNNMYNYYSGNLSWLFSNTFSISNSWFTNGKLRGSIAKVGNDTGPYETQQYYSISQTPLPYPLGNISSQLAFFDFMPEETYSWEIGTNLEFFENKFGLDLTYYWSNAVNQIMNVPLLPSTRYFHYCILLLDRYVEHISINKKQVSSGCRNNQSRMQVWRSS